MIYMMAYISLSKLSPTSDRILEQPIDKLLVPDLSLFRFDPRGTRNRLKDVGHFLFDKLSLVVFDSQILANLLQQQRSLI